MAHKSMELTLAKLRDDPRFFLVEKVERDVRVGPRTYKRDLFELIDVLAIGPGITLGVQCTSVGGVTARKRKITEHPNTPFVLAAGWQLEIWGWHQPRGPRTRWELGRHHHFELTTHDSGATP